MDVETLVRIGIRFSYSRAATFPQIPYVQDVFFVLQLSDKKDERNYYSSASANWPEYIENLMLLAAAVAPMVLVPEGHYNGAEARKVIARAIMDLCPDEAKCLFNHAFVEAKKAAGEEVPETANRDELPGGLRLPRVQADHP